MNDAMDEYSCILCKVCNLLKHDSKYIKIFSYGWEGDICIDCIKSGLILNTEDGNILIDYQPKFNIPGFEEIVE